MKCSSAPRPFVKWIRKARTEAKLSGFSLIHFKQEIPGDFATGLFWAGNRCWNCVASISVQKKSYSKTCLKGLGRITGLSFHSKISFNIQLENVSKVLLKACGRWWWWWFLLWPDDHDFNFPCKWFSFESKSGCQRLRCPCRARVFLGPPNATAADSIQNFRLLQKFRQFRISRSFSSCQCHQICQIRHIPSKNIWLATNNISQVYKVSWHQQMF